MLRNYIKVALRRFRSGGTHATVNVVGLALGMAVCSLIFLLVHHEWSYDRFHANADRIYRVYLEYVSPDGEPGYQALMAPDFTPSFKSSFPQVEGATRFAKSERDFRIDDEMTREDLAEVDADFFRMFSFPSVAGDAVAAIADPTSAVLTTEAAAALFDIRDGNWQRAIGQSFEIPVDETSYSFSVGAVIEPMPNNSSIEFDAAISFENYDNIYVGGNNWGGRTTTYAMLSPGTDAGAFEASLRPFTDLEMGEYIANMRGAENIAQADDAYAMRLQPLTNMHQNVQVWLPYEADAHNPRYSWILAGIGSLILLIACINFMTLSVGQSTIRAREVGVRKVLGASRTQIARQHWGESVVVAAVALLVGVLLALLSLPAFNNLTGAELSLSSVSPLLIFLVLMLLVGIVGIVAGSYPAMILSAFRPAQVLKGSVTSPRLGLLTRALVVLQFTISIGLIAGTVIMSKQLNYLLHKDLGFDNEQVLAVNTQQVSRTEADGVLNFFKDQLRTYPGVEGVARAGTDFTRGSDRNGWADASGNNRSAYDIGVDYTWADVLGIEIVKGRNFSMDYPSDPTRAILVNEKLVEEFGIEDPIGYEMTNFLSWVYKDETPVIIGVVKDFNFRSLHSEVEPTIMNLHPDYYNYFRTMLIKVSPDNVSQTVAHVEDLWNEILPGKPFTYSFIDDDFAARYQTEQRWRKLVAYSSTLAIVIASLGLFGLAILVVSRRTKEIGIRKVLGASVAGVTALLSREFALLVLIASLIAGPLTYFAMRSWLESFAFRVSIGPWAFVGATVLTLVIALGTVGFQALRAASANPVKALRYE